MKIIIYQNREVYKEESKIGNDSENKVETLEFEFPEEYKDFTKYIEFQIKGEKYVDLVEDNKYVITREVAKYGKIKTQLVLKKNIENDVLVFKSDIFTLNVSNSINATENLVHTVGIDLIEKIVTKNSEQDVRLDTLEADNTTNKENILNLQNDNTTNKTNIKSLQDDNEVNKTDISNIKQEQTVQNTNIQELQTDNTSNKSKIEALETKNTQQDTNIQKNTESIAEINAKDAAQDEEIAQIKEKDTVQDSLIEQLQAENTKLKKEINSMQIPGEATGNPIHLSDSSDMECEIVPIGGAEQETVTDNLFNNTWEQGIIASETGAEIDSTENIRSSSVEVHANHLYSISRSIYTSYMSFRFYAKDGAYLGNQLTEGIMTASNTDKRMNANESSMTFTITNANVARMRIVDNSNNLSTIYILTTEAINPDYPSPVETVGSNINLLENKAITQTINGVTFTVNKDGCVMVNGTATTNTTFKINDDIVPKNISNLILSGCPNNGSKSTYDLKIELYKNGVWTKVLYDFGNGVDTGDLSEYTSCTRSTTIRKDYNANNLIFKPKLEKGSKATPYSPYGQGSVEIYNCNGNLFNKNDITQNGFLSQSTDEILSSTKSSVSNYIKIKKLKNYIVSGYGTDSYYKCICFYDKDKAFISAISATSSNNIYGGMAPEKAKYLRFHFPNSQINNIQLEEGETATNYIEHESYTKVLPIQKEFVKIGEVEDTFVKVDGKWYEKHNIKKLILDGTESWNWHSDGFGFAKAVGISILPNDKVLAISNFLLGIQIGSNGTYYKDKDNVIFSWMSGNLICLKAINKFTDVEMLKAWLAEQYNAGTPVIVYYVLSEPELIECTAEQEEILNSFYTYKGVTNVSMSGIGKIKIIYKQDQQTINKNYENRLAALEAAIIS